MAASENLENLAKRAEELFKTLSAKDSENPKVFLDKKRRDIENLAKELAKDIGDIITVLEMYHKACLAAQIAGNIAVISGKVLLLGATALYLLAGGSAREILAAAVAKTGKTVSFVGTMTSKVAAAAEDILEHKQVKTLPEKMETLKEYMQDQFLYSCMVDKLLSFINMVRNGKAILDDGKQLRDFLYSSAAKAMAELSDPTTIFGSIKDLYSKIESLVRQIKELYEGKQTKLVEQLLVFKRDLEGIAQGKFQTPSGENPRCWRCGKIINSDTHTLIWNVTETIKEPGFLK